MPAPPGDEKTNPLTPDSLAAEGAGDGDRNQTARLGRYGTAKARNHQMAGYLLGAGEESLSRRMYRCGNYLHFREWMAHGGKMTLHSGHFCQIGLMCPLCAIRRGGKMLRRYVERAQFIARTHDLWMVTLTVKNGPDLEERYNHLNASLKRLRERAKKGYGAMARSDGALWSTEFTKRETGWHPHVHMVWAMPRGQQFDSIADAIAWGDGSQLKTDWHAITKDSYIVHAVPITADQEDKLVNAFCEVLKYALKFSGLTLEENYHAYKTLKGKRLIRASGIWWGLELPEDARLEDDPLDGPYIEHVYRFAGQRGYILEDVWAGTQHPPLQVPNVTPTLHPESNP